MSDPRVIPANQVLSFEDGPDRGRIIVDGASTGEVYALMEWTVAANPDPDSQPSYGPHRHHGCEETFLVQAGCLRFLLDDSIITLSQGDFVRVPRGVRHGYFNATTEPVRLLVGFQPAGLETLFVKYRSDRVDTMPEEGFVAEATRRFASNFE
jgi:mannose-6-phosphate isomerase-like protein (cupin superfamily)